MIDYICTSCNYIGPKKLIRSRSFRLRLLFLLLAAITFGISYLVWFLLFRKYGCPKCGETVMVPVRKGINPRRFEASLCDEEELKEELVDAMMEKQSFQMPEPPSDKQDDR